MKNETLHRLPEQGKIAGVAAGLAEYFEIDVSLMRVIWVVLAIATNGAAVLGYFILAVILPTPDEAVIDIKPNDSKNSSEATSSNIRNYLGIGLVILGVWTLGMQFMPSWLNVRWDFIWPATLILAGVFLLVRKRS